MSEDYNEEIQEGELEKRGENKPKRDERGRLLPGNTANPNGRPPGSISITAEIKKKLLEVPAGQQKTYLEALVSTILKKALTEGNEQLIKQIWAYVDGMPKIGIESSSKSEIVVNQNVNFLEKLFLNLDYDTKQKLNARLLEIADADEQTGNTEYGLQAGPVPVDREGDLPAEISNEELEVGESAPGMEQDVDDEQGDNN